MYKIKFLKETTVHIHNFDIYTEYYSEYQKTYQENEEIKVYSIIKQSKGMYEIKMQNRDCFYIHDSRFCILFDIKEFIRTHKQLINSNYKPYVGRKKEIEVNSIIVNSDNNIEVYCGDFKYASLRAIQEIRIKNNTVEILGAISYLEIEYKKELHIHKYL